MEKIKRILIKVSGEGLSSKKDRRLSIDPKIVTDLVKQIKSILSDGNAQVALVVGGGNFWRGVSAARNGIPRSRADYIGMLATLMNALALQSGFEQAGVKAKVQSAINIDGRVAENFVLEEAIAAMNRGEVVIFGGGTGRPYFTTDTTATLVACEIEADLVYIGKNGVDGIYDSDPKKNPNAKRFDVISWDEILERRLEVMDSTAASMASSNNLDVICFNITEKNAILRVHRGKITHTKVTNAAKK